MEDDRRCRQADHRLGDGVVVGIATTSDSLEINGYRREDAQDRKSTMDTYWMPGVNHLVSYARWASAEFTDLYTITADVGAKVDV
jgi:hypothetical protein